ncbi:Retrovirus-related Pol polyprotein LINE-1, partial [Heterocephalus glaber]
HCWWEYRLMQPLWKSVWRYLKELGLEVPFDPAIPLIAFAILGLFLFQMNFWIVFSRSMKYAAGISIGIALNL